MYANLLSLGGELELWCIVFHSFSTKFCRFWLFCWDCPESIFFAENEASSLWHPKWSINPYPSSFTPSPLLEILHPQKKEGKRWWMVRENPGNSLDSLASHNSLQDDNIRRSTQRGGGKLKLTTNELRTRMMCFGCLFRTGTNWLGFGPTALQTSPAACSRFNRVSYLIVCIVHRLPIDKKQTM